MATQWKNLPDRNYIAKLADAKDLKKESVSGKVKLFIEGGIPGGEGDVKGISVTIDPNTYVMTTQLKDGTGGNVGSPATVDLPLESMVVGGEYDEDTKSIILTLKNGQTVTFSVADLVSGLQTEITEQNPLSADLVAETADKNFVTSEEKEDIGSISEISGTVETLAEDVSGLQGDMEGKQDVIDGNNPLNADYIDDSNSEKKLVDSDVAAQLEDIASSNYNLAGINTEVIGSNYGNAQLFSPDWEQSVNFYLHSDDGDINGPWVDIDVNRNGESVACSFPSHPEPGIIDDQLEYYTVLSEFLTQGVYQLIGAWSTDEKGVGYDENWNIVYPLNTGEAMGLYIVSDCYDGIETTTRIIAHPVNGGVKVWEIDLTFGTVVNSYMLATMADLQTALTTKQDVIDSSHKLSADLIAETNTNKVMTASERTKLSGIATGAEVNVQSNWNETNSSSDAYIQNKPTNVSAFTNDSGYQTASDVSSAIGSAIGGITSFDYQVVQTLPASGVKGTIYLVPTEESGEPQNIYEEYIWVIDEEESGDTGRFELIGTTEIDLSDYVTNSDLHDYTASVLFTSENGFEVSDDDGNTIDINIETDAETGSHNLGITGPDGSFNVPNAEDVAAALEGKANAVDPSLLPQDAEQQGVIVVEDHTEIDAEAVEKGQIVVDTTENKVYIVADILTDPETGDSHIEWHEIQTENEVIYIPMTITSVQDMTFTVPYTPSEVSAMLAGGMKVMYRLTIPQRISPSLDAGVYDFTAFCSYQSGQVIMATMVGASGNNNIFGIAYHIPSAMGNSVMEMRFLQNKIDANNKLSADLIDNSSSTNKTYETGTGAPTTSTTGSVGELYVDSSTGNVYVCTDDTGGTYTWQKTGTITAVKANGTLIASSGEANIPAATTTNYGVTELTESSTSGATGKALAACALNNYSQRTVTGAPVYSTSYTYSVGDLVRRGDYTWRCNTAITTPEEWNASHWTGLDPIQRQIDNLATVAKTGSYADLTNKPTIPTVNNATLTIQKNGTTVQTFTANASSNATANIEVPVITMQTTDPGEGATLAANNFIAVYEA